jgi:hypothetical protein
MDGKSSKTRQPKSRRLQHDDNLYEEVFKLSCSGRRRTPPEGGHRLVRESDATDIDVTPAANEPLRIRIRG